MTERKEKPVLLSGIQPSGKLMIGNYLGAIANWVRLQESCECYFVLVDLHSITVRQDPEHLRRRSYDFLAQYLACGVDPERSVVFVQSHVPGHAQLAWVLNCFTYMGELGRMTQFKDKAEHHNENVNAGLFTYPVLMAADILLFGADLVPVGEDQKQHVELARDIAGRFNGLFGEVFTMPRAYMPEVGARIMSLQEPTKKMSKSDENANNYIALLDSPDVICRKLKRAVTDSACSVVYDEERPGVANLMTLYSCVTGDSFESIEGRFAGRGYGEFKEELADAAIAFLGPLQERYRAKRSDETGLDAMLKRGAEAARECAAGTLSKVHDAVGFIAPIGSAAR